ncbi:MAG: hypothetical protein IKG19_03055 [Lachnospiraceae bacterium]|nr:hypothetical protein [Lachnospiraceae bacterium]
MLSFLYLIIATAIGWQITDLFITDRAGSRHNLIWVRLASSFGVGVLIFTWPLYLIAYTLRVAGGIERPLGYANIIVLGFSFIILGLTFFGSRKNTGESGSENKSSAVKSGAILFGSRKNTGESDSEQTSGAVSETAPENGRKGLMNILHTSGLIRDDALFKEEAIFYLIVLAFVWFSFHYVLHMNGKNIQMGFTVFSDYAPNVALIRSFSWFANYPTEYPFYAGEDIKYHFMFMFFTGNMEFLRLPLTFAYNLTSTLSLFSFFIMLSQLALRITGRFASAVLTAIFFTFRSGMAVFLFISEHVKAGDLVQAFLTNENFIGYTTNESWGLWNYNVYLNQRHLGFGMIIATAVIWYFYGYLEEACGSKKADDAYTMTSALTSWVKDFFLTKEAWIPKAPDLALVTGIILGLTSFWNGACVIGSLLILAGFAIYSKNKLDYLILAMVSVLIAELQTKAFIYGSAVSPTFFWGFISEDKSFLGVIGYIAEVAGITILGSVFALLIADRKQRTLITSFLLPVVFSFTVSLTPDVTVNHKYIMMAMAYLSIIWADIVVSLFTDRRGHAPEKGEVSAEIEHASEDGGMPAGKGHTSEDVGMPAGKGHASENVGMSAGKRHASRHGNVPGKMLAVVVALLLTATGLYDYTIIIRDNDDKHCITVDTTSDLTAYAKENFTNADLILSGPDSVSELTVSGCRLYCGWPYYAWSAGYDTDARFDLAKLMYTSMSAEDLLETVKAEGITYILYENNMYYDDVPANEEPIQEICDLVFASENGLYRLYKVRDLN